MPNTELDDDALLRRAESWVAGDPDPETARELRTLIATRSSADLRERMATSLEFGTAGLRGIVRAGSNGMNRAAVIRTTRAVGEYFIQKFPDARALSFVVGYDARRSSREFADDVVAVLLALGVRVRTFDGPVPTPLVAFAARELSAVGAIVITASHNPPEYNGYKLYGPNAIQIVSPMDREIAEKIAEIGAAAAVPRAAVTGAEPVPNALFDRYLAELSAVLPPGEKDRDFDIVYTPLHGVGGEFAKRALAHFGFERVHVVAEQAEPDGTFPTVPFPNPEEAGVLDQALDQAKRLDAELVLANDPDADRLAVAVRTPTGRVVTLSGNQIGALLADYLLTWAARPPRPLVVSTIVSSPMLASIAEVHDARYEMTLTGFKWMWTAAAELERTTDSRFCFAYEEALGFSVSRQVRDKDGISSAVAIAELAAACRARGSSLLDRLHALYKQHGLWVSAQRNIILKSDDARHRALRALEQFVAAPPAELNGKRIAHVRDFASGAETRARWLAQTALVEIECEDGTRVRIRPSGTEPKLKIYVDLKAVLNPDAPVGPAEEQAQQNALRMADTVAQFFQVD